jgi:hypothetical protein
MALLHRFHAISSPHLLHKFAVQTGHIINKMYVSLAASAEGLGAWLMNPSLPAAVLTSPPFAWSLAVSRAMSIGAWGAFFVLLQQASHVQACFCHLLFLEVCSRHLRCQTCSLASAPLLQLSSAAFANLPLASVAHLSFEFES